MSSQIELAFQSASELSRLFITVAAGILALSVSFARDILKNPTRTQVSLLSTSWSLYLSSIIFGFWSLMALTGSLEDISQPLTQIETNARIPATIQVILFVVATVFFIICGRLSLLSLGRAEGNARDRSTPERPRVLPVSQENPATTNDKPHLPDSGSSAALYLLLSVGIGYALLRFIADNSAVVILGTILVAVGGMWTASYVERVRFAIRSVRAVRQSRESA